MNSDSSPPAGDSGKKRLNLRAAKAVDGDRDLPPWPILVVDDDPQVHGMTAVLLRDFRFKDRGFIPVSAHSAAEARTILENRSDIPVMLLDVVMETDHAGLSLAQVVRQELGNTRLRIILRTGQPGEAPEREVMLSYDINDYRSKTELTAQKLFTALVGALRSWIDIDTIEKLNATLEARVLERTHALAEAQAFSERLVELLPNPLWVKDLAGHYRLYNRAFREFFGIETQSWLGYSAEEVLGRHLPPEELESDCRVLEGSSRREEFETQIPDCSGRNRALLVTKAALPADGVVPNGIIGMAIDISERKNLERELRRLATMDPLTGIANRRHFTALAHQEIERAHRYDLPLSVIMLDVDFFKTVNDSWGHAIGDELLKALTATMAEQLREVDVLGRMGGEEFAVFLPQTSLEGATQLAERLRTAVAALHLPVVEGGLRTTISLGVTTRLEGETLFDHLLSRADRAMYQAKQMGRNRVTAESGQ
ncbi:sensor domain-containing diguanylate cyclase [Magnetospirillum sulfuroxidans]|uniref:diguanylate cyclase n=1 Tax=Magnetospirillum sulfuroxidans TaxID=611300 RepID=A0ABS5IBS8_9PROT|nr:diguanylate cyclase [Magnetospirillum sulfuroxidans]MBR9971764.1 diguanylate cyclase [Magnetospirillum sulfuroxidans]